MSLILTWFQKSSPSKNSLILLISWSNVHPSKFSIILLFQLKKRTHFSSDVSRRTLFRPKLLSKIEETGGRIIVPTGALIGLDAVKAAAEGTIHQVKMVSTKPIKSLLAAPFLKEKNLILEDMVTPTKIFSGNALEAAIGFPENTNITAALSLAGIGPEKTLLEIWADPKTDRNIHTVELKGTETSFSVTIEGIPSSTNAASGLLTPLSLISTLRDLTSPLKVGS